ncbi:MAG: ABC transporter permease [Pseudomonadota bacterium]
MDQFLVENDGRPRTLSLRGSWTTEFAPAIEASLAGLICKGGDRVLIDGTAVERLDTTGALLIDLLIEKSVGDRAAADLIHFSAEQNQLIGLCLTGDQKPSSPQAPSPSLAMVLERFGRGAIGFQKEVVNLVAFFGELLTVFVKTIIRGKGIRVVSFVHHLEHTGLYAVPIVCLVTFLIGAVLAFLGADILRQFGAEIFVTELIAFSFLREFGVLLTAVMVAGRSGSAFTAQIGAMKSQEEVDAIRALGLDPIELLVLPRVLALIVAMPLLTFIANIMGLFGGGLVSWFMLDISPGLYLDRITETIGLKHFRAGMVKAPVFAVLIALIGCYQGMQVRATAQSIGERTTSAVVQAIFVVIIVDALFAMLFIQIGW